MEKNIKSLLKEINYSKIDKILKQAPERTETTLDKLIKYFKKKSIKLSEVEKAWLIYKWITLNFEYDFEGVNNKNYDITEEATFKRGKTICSGYSKLYKKICDNLDLIVEIITGHSKGFNYELTDKFEESESHAWNAIKIKELWYFIETTWGAGYSEDHKHFIKKFNPYHFFTPPIQFIRSHFPDESKWQLLPKNEIINQKRFMEFIDLKSDFYNLGFDSIEPDLTFNYVNEKGNFKIFFDEEKINPNKLKLMAKLSFIKNKDILSIKKENINYKYMEQKLKKKNIMNYAV
jgi:transglutaminase/protease-like cytokinesis protein 3